MTDPQKAFDAIVLAGGAGRRLDGADKASLEIGEIRLLDRALAAVANAETIVIAGPRRPIEGFSHPRLVWTREEPAGSGPASAIVHALALVRGAIVVVIAVDAPFAATAIPRLIEALPGHDAALPGHDAAMLDHDAAMLLDDAGRRQPLIAVYATEALRRRAGGESWADRSVRSLVEGLRVAEVGARNNESLDCDTPADVARARTIIQAPSEIIQAPSEITQVPQEQAPASPRIPTPKPAG